jgi:hypothetical protein
MERRAMQVIIQQDHVEAEGALIWRLHAGGKAWWLCRSIMHNTRREGRACTNAANLRCVGQLLGFVHAAHGRKMQTDMHMHRRRMQHGLFW